MASNEEMYVDGIPISDLRVVDLKEQLEKRGLSKSGSKTILVKRLKDQLALENLQKAQIGKDPSTAPNMEMKTCGNDFVAEYLEKQQQMLQAAKVAAARSAAVSGQSPPTYATSSTSGSILSTPNADHQLVSPPSSRRSRSSKSKSPRQPVGDKEVALGGGYGSTDSTAIAMSVLMSFTTPAATTDKSEPVVAISQPVVEAETAVADSGLVAVEKPAVEAIEPPTSGVDRSRLDEQPQPDADNSATNVETVKSDTAAVAGVISTELVRESPPDTELPQHSEAPPPHRSPSLSRDLAPCETLPVEAEGDQSRESTTRDTDDGERAEKGSTSSSSAEGEEAGTRLSENDDRDRIDDDSVAAATIPADESDEVEMEISAPINAADELFEAVNTAIPPTTTGGGKMGDESVESVQSAVEKESRDIPQRKRKWVAATLPKRTAVSISSDSLKDIVGSVKDSVKEEEISAAADDVDASPTPKRIVISRDVSIADSATELETDVQQSRRVEIDLSRAPAKMTEDGFIRASSPSPARHSPSNIIHVRGLTRPFTIQSLHELLEKYGNFSKEDFWIDNIKSHCIVKYMDESAAVMARERLHNIQWPPTNTKILRVDFATQEDLDRHRSQEGPPARLSRQITENEKERQSISDQPARQIREVRKSDRDDRSHRSTSPRRGDLDRGKIWRSGESPPTDPRGAGGRRRASQSPERRGGDARRDQPAQPAKLLDELFRKTKATPCIYWLPLSTEQVREKERERKKREQERYERVKKMEEEERERRREPYRRHSPFDYRNRRR